MNPRKAGRPDPAVVRAEMSEVADLFDADFYAEAHPWIERPREELLEEFCTDGWRRLRKPRRDFDLWWYWANHLDPAHEDVNPLVHYVRTGRAAGLSTRPASVAAGPGATLPVDRPVRRACLFAAFDGDGMVDEVTLRYLAELARFADVFCLYDNYVPEAELAKVRALGAEVWSIRHGAYDFGSYSLLARELVGWDRLAEYDEVLFVNDSCYLLRPLDDVFARMDAEACDWWGLQATKGIALTREAPGNDFAEPIALDTVRDELLARWEDDAVYDFLLGSYFLAFRRPVLDDPVFRRLVDSVVVQRGKLSIIQKYEIGLTHVLIGRGHRFSTYMPDLYPFHPVFTDWAYTMIEGGFPLLKRLFVYLNHYDVPGVSRWRERLRELVPDAPVEALDAHLRRTAPDDQLQRSFAVQRQADGSVWLPDPPAGSAFTRRDKEVPKRADLWVFAVDPVTHRLPDNSRVLFERVADDPDLTKVVLTRSRRLEPGGVNVVSVPLLGEEGREHLMRAGVVLVAGRPRESLQVTAARTLHTVVAVRGGLMLTKHATTADGPRTAEDVRPESTGPLEMLHPARRRALTAVLTASDLDQLAEIAALWPARYGDAWRTGIPLHDELLADQSPAALAAEEDEIRRLLDGRRLLLIHPVARAHGGAEAPAALDAATVAHLAVWAEREGTVLGVREPVTDLDRPFTRLLGEVALDLSPQRFPTTTAVLRASDALLTDYDGSALDLAVTGRPVVSFAPDLAHVAGSLLYDLDHLFPGPVCRDVDALVAALETVFEPPAAVVRQQRRVVDLLVDHRDGRNTARVLDRLLAREAASA